MSILFDDMLLSRRLPGSIADDPQVSAAAAAIDPQLGAIAQAADLPSIINRLGALSSAQLDHVARHFDVDAWRDEWDIARKRAVFAASYKNKRRMGTLAAVKEAIAAFGAGARIVEWWQKSPKGEPHTFTVEIAFSSAETLPTADLQAQVKALIDAAKPARSQYEMVIIESIGTDANTGSKATGITPAPVFVGVDNV